MEFVPAGNTAMCELIFLMHGQRIQNTLYYSNSNPLTAGILADLGGSLIEWWIGNMKARISADVRLLQVELTDLSSATAEVVTVVPPEPIFGDGAADALPGNCALCVSLRSGGRGRSARGRNYVAGIPEGQHSGSQVNQSWADLVRTAYDTARTLDVGEEIYNMVVVSRVSGGVPRETAQVLNVTSVVLVDYAVDSQRRRLPGRGQ